MYYQLTKIFLFFFSTIIINNFKTKKKKIKIFCKQLIIDLRLKIDVKPKGYWRAYHSVLRQARTRPPDRSSATIARDLALFQYFTGGEQIVSNVPTSRRITYIRIRILHNCIRAIGVRAPKKKKVYVFFHT